MLGSTDGLHVGCMYAHVNKHIFSTHQVLLQYSINHQSKCQPPKDHRKEKTVSKCPFTLLVASFGSFGKPLTEFESIERKICTVKHHRENIFICKCTNICKLISIVTLFLLPWKI